MSEPSFSGWAGSQTGNPKGQVSNSMIYALTKIQKEIHIVHILVVIFGISGLFFVLPCTDTFVKVDLRTISFDIPPQEASFIFQSCFF